MSAVKYHIAYELNVFAYNSAGPNLNSDFSNQNSKLKFRIGRIRAYSF